MRKITLIALICCLSLAAKAQISITPGTTPAALIAGFVGSGLTVSNITVNCPSNAYGTFTNGSTTNIGINNGAIFTTGNASGIVGPNTVGSDAACNGTSGGDPDLLAIQPSATEDPCVVEFDIIPQCNQLTLRYVFGSEEYPEFVGAAYNDAFAFFISGPGPACQAGYYNNTNVATLPDNVTPVSIDNVNSGNNSAYYVNNIGGATIQYDGFTTVLTRTVSICPCQTYHFKIAIADAGDCYYDSGVLLEMFQCTQPLTAAITATNTTCGASNGRATVTASGVGPFTYTWSPSGGTGATATGLAAGVYTVTVDDGLACSPAITSTVDVAGSASSIGAVITQTDVTCAGNSDGRATVAPSGGTGPYTYSWTPGGSTAVTATGLAAGNYTVIATDANGCTGTATCAIIAPATLTATSTQTDVVCFGGSTGAASVSASGGTPGYTYSWSPSGGTAATATGLSAGNYSVTITDNNSCVNTQTVSLTQPSATTLAITSTSISCNGGTGSASVTVSGGASPFTYTWSPSGGNAATASGLTAGTYTLNTTDANSCAASETVSISQPAALVASATSTNVTCQGAGNGIVNATISGGTSPYTYTWSPSGGNAATASGLTPGTYTVTSEDANSCVVTQTVSISSPPVLSGVVTTGSVACNGGSTGTATISAAGGTSPYTYTWSPSGGNAATASGLSAGNYTVTVNDANACVLTRTLSITEATAMSFSANTTSLTCSGTSAGAATLTVSGGTASYSYTWSPSGGFSATASSLSAGDYTVRVRDANACIQTTTVTIATPPTFSVNSVQSDAACYGGSSGRVMLFPGGGTGTYTYSWTPTAATTSSVGGLPAGTYSVDVRDANNCLIRQSYVIGQPTPLAIVMTHTDVVCNGASTGVATATVSGGTPSYSYTWAPSVGFGANASSLPAGTYTLNVTDNYACPISTVVTIAEPTAYTLSVNSTSIACNGQSTGSATVNVSGNTAPYTYTWSPFGGNAATASSLAANNYTVAIRDANGCATSTVVPITEPTVLSVSSGQSNVACYGGSTAGINLGVSGGTPAYSYSWSPTGVTTSSLTNASAGVYTVEVTDANSCSVIRSYTITESPALVASMTHTDVICFSVPTAVASVSVSGGVGPYSYAWTPTGGSAATANSLAAGAYTVNVLDALSCPVSATVSITQPPAYTVTATSSSVTCNGGTNGTASFTVSGNTAPYTYTWSPSGGNADNASGLTAGTYTLAILDANNCSTSGTVTIVEPSALSGVMTQTNVGCNGQSTAVANYALSGGITPYTYTWSPSGGNAATASNLSAGTYTLAANDANGCAITQTVTITEPAVLAAVATQTNASCHGFSNGIASIAASGGTTPYTYTWSPSGGNAATANSLAAGSYTLTLQDAQSCTLTQTFTITEPTVLTATSTQTNASCFGATNGVAEVSASGGTTPYTYTWTPSGGNAATASGLTAGTYSVTLEDAQLCTLTQTFTITEPTALSAATTQTNVSCIGLSDATASVTVSGGTTPYTYTWTPSGTATNTISGIPAGSYTLNILDAQSCALTQTVSITEPTQFTVSVTTNSVVCNGQSNGSATVTVSGATAPYTYTWSPSGGNAATATGLAANQYTVSIEDAHLCATTTTLSIIEPTLLTGTVTHTDVTCYGIGNGVATASLSGGVGPYTYTWSPAGGNAATATGLAPGNYTIAAQDANLCVLNQTLTIGEAPQYTISVSSSSVICNAQSNGSATVTVSGATPPYTYTWSPSGGNAAVASNLSAGIYSVAISDANSCVQTRTVSVIEPAQLVSTVSFTNVSCFGSANGIASVSATGGITPYTYSWTPTGANTTTFTNLPPGAYSVTTRDANLCTTTNTVMITQPTQYTLSASSSSVQCYGQNTGFGSVNVSGNTGPYTYTWSPSGGNAYTATNLSAGVYTVSILDSHNCPTSQNLTIAQPAPLTGTMGVAAANCGNTDGVAAINVSGGVGPYTYTWSPTGGNAYTSNGVATGNYTVTVKDANNCVISQSVLVPVVNPTIAVTASTPSLCAGNSATLSATGCSSYTWTPNTGLSSANAASVTATPAATTHYTVTGANPYGCTVTQTVTLVVYPLPGVAITAASPSICIGSTTTLTATGATNYAWTPAPGLTLTSGSVTTVNPAASQDYTVTGTDINGCVNTSTINIHVWPLPVVGASASSPTVCAGDATLLTATGATTYTWSTGSPLNPLTVTPPVNNTTYTVTGTDINGCVNTATVAIGVNPRPTVSISGNTVVCQGSSTTLTASGATTYTWNTSAISPTLAVTPNASTTYTVIGTDNNGCRDTASFLVTVYITPTIGISGTDTICDGDLVTLTAWGGTNGYAWSTGDLAPSITYPYSATTIISVASGTVPCIGTASFTITVNPLPSVAVTAVPDSIIYGQATLLGSTTSGNLYNWQPNNGLNCTNCPDPIAHPNATTQYTLEVTDGNGCKNTDTVTVFVDMICGELFTPTGFSPNNDGNNDTWCVYGNCIQTMECHVFNRWGQLVYTMSSRGDCWDGTYNGVMQNAGVYIYEVNAVLINGDVKSKKGNFTLVK